MAINNSPLAGFAKLIVFTTILIDIMTFANFEKQYSPLYYAKVHVQALRSAGSGHGSTSLLYGPIGYINDPVSRLKSDPITTNYNLVLDRGTDYSIRNDDDPNHQDHHDPNNDAHNEDITSELSLDYGGHETIQSSSSSSSSFQERPELSETYSLPDEKVHISRAFIKENCQLDRGSQRGERLNNTYLTYCTRYKLKNLLSDEILMSIMHQDSKECERILDEFIQLDELINQFDHLFTNLLKRYNCHNGYSVKWNCEDCKNQRPGGARVEFMTGPPLDLTNGQKAYKDWICATTLPFYTNGLRIKPCLSFCERVEQRCPYLHPITKEQYGGQPVFICRDPNIPFVPEITPDIPFSEPGKCYDLCHLSDNSSELLIDSLSKYEYDKCPDKVSIAEKVSIINNYSGSTETSMIAATTTIEDVDQFNEDPVAPTNRTTRPGPQGEHKVPYGGGGHPDSRKHVHNKKLDDLREVLTVYKNQPKTHRFGHHAEHAAIVPPTRPYIEIHSS